MIMDAANQLGIPIPHFCYHKKLSIAANCRMCLVDVEKAPKPLPACATPVSIGMKVRTASPTAKKAQQGVMEFLLINHPLDCPICDQGGECQLQDLSVGYGQSSSRYDEPKRVVIHKQVGPLVAMEEMSRCIHCTRCVRFGQEIAGVMELGMLGRGEHSEITTFVGQTVDSELSGNMIDICPVGALTSKPFRYSARTWEMTRRRSISPHDALGSNLVVQVKNDKVMRVVPWENEEVNECWLSDKDRFSYEGLNHPDRLTEPMIRRGDVWQTVDWAEALDYVVQAFKKLPGGNGVGQIGGILSPHATLEELYLAQKLLRGLGSEHIDHRLRQIDFSTDTAYTGVPWLGMNIADVNKLDRLLIVGAFLRKEQPLLAQRVRQRVKQSKVELSLLQVVDDDERIRSKYRHVLSPHHLLTFLERLLLAVKNPVAEDTPEGEIAHSLRTGRNTALWLGNWAMHSAYAGEFQWQLQQITDSLLQLGDGRKVSWGVPGEAANSTGAYLAGAIPGVGGLNAYTMLQQARKAYLVLHADPRLDGNHGHLVNEAMKQAQCVVALSSFKSVTSFAHIVLPTAPFTETSGTFVNMEGRAQSFQGVVSPLGNTRPAWKIIRVLGNMLGLAGFDYDTSEQVRDECLHGLWIYRLNNRLNPPLSGHFYSPSSMSQGEQAVGMGGVFQRIADVPIYSADPLVRHAMSLQKTKDAHPSLASLSGSSLRALGIAPGASIKVTSLDANTKELFTLHIPGVLQDDRIPLGCIRIPAAQEQTMLINSPYVRVEGIQHAG